jgi:hypothetical protein
VEAVNWHSSRQIISEVGSDPAAYRQKLREQLLQDPEFRKEAMGAWQQQANTARAAPNIRLPSLSKVGSAALPSNDEQDLTDAALWKNAMAAKRA